MRKLTYILLSCMICLSCANETKYKSSEVILDEEADIPMAEEIRAPGKPYSEEIVSQKLTEYFDLLQLQKGHPEFKEDIFLQLKTLSNDTVFYRNYENVKSVDNIRQIGDFIHLSDSVQQVKVYFDVLTPQKRFSDSVLAKITVKNVIAEDSSIPSYKVQFQKLD